MAMTDPLIKKLQSTKEGSRELSDEFLKALGYTVDPQGLWWDPSKSFSIGGPSREDPTRNIYNAIQFVPDYLQGRRIDFGKVMSMPTAQVKLTTYLGDIDDEPEDHDPPIYVAQASTASLAICIAILKSKGFLP